MHRMQNATVTDMFERKLLAYESFERKTRWQGFR